MDVRDLRVLVMGLGVHGGGLGVACWLLAHGAQVTVTDQATREALARPLAELDAVAERLGTQVDYTLGEHRERDFLAADMIVVNPAVRPDSPWLALAQRQGVPVETEMTLFFRLCPGPILGVTGTKGKTTTTMLLAAMLREQFPQTVSAGNLRVSALAALAAIDSATPVVLELSSFQLERLGAVGISPTYAVITNLSPDHLNWHGSMEAYTNAKRQIFAHQDHRGVVVFPVDDPRLRPTAEYCGRAIGYAAQPDPSAAAMIDADAVLRLYGETLLGCADIELIGKHNQANVLAAAALARSFGLAPAQIRQAVRTFRGVEHRLELVRELDGVRYINDTTATNPAAAIAALTAVDPPIILIAGGADKQLSLEDLAAMIAERARAVVLLQGSATPALQQQLAEVPGLPVFGPYDQLEPALQHARRLAEPGASVLLSPGCASFGMFRNEFHRGEEFRRLVEQL
jgi:UDP-N-acetylmuramoylalanine--D-glutamate ligase